MEPTNLGKLIQTDWVLGEIPCCKKCFDEKTPHEIRDAFVDGVPNDQIRDKQKMDQ